MFDTPEEREEFRNHLKDFTVIVKFTKKDGSVRNMQCTLRADLVTPVEKKTNRTKSVNDDVCPVYDLDKKEWRSFRYDSIISVRYN